MDTRRDSPGWPSEAASSALAFIDDIHIRESELREIIGTTRRTIRDFPDGALRVYNSGWVAGTTVEYRSSFPIIILAFTGRSSIATRFTGYIHAVGAGGFNFARQPSTVAEVSVFYDIAPGVYPLYIPPGTTLGLYNAAGVGWSTEMNLLFYEVRL